MVIEFDNESLKVQKYKDALQTSVELNKREEQLSKSEPRTRKGKNLAAR